MSSPAHANNSTSQQKGGTLPLAAWCKYVTILGLFLFFFCMVLFDTSHYRPYNLLATFKQKRPSSNSTNISYSTKTPFSTPTNLSHIVFGIAGSMNTWKRKRFYTQAWWRPNVTRGYLFLDRPPTKEFLPWSPSSPPFRVNEDVAILKLDPKVMRPFQTRIVRTILELFRQGDQDVRWFVMADDDTVFAVDNLVEALAKYDHTKKFYIGTNSECVKSNFDFAFEMAFGGAGYALSYPLVATLVGKLDACIRKYARAWVTSDLMLYSCLSDLGVALTHNPGFHQIDLFRDVSGLLSSHPQTPFLSLHHIDNINPIFPNKNRPDSINHLMKAATADQSRLLQQTICHHRPTNWTFSISWGYSAHIYESILPRSFLRKPLETFKPWTVMRPPVYMFNTRWPTNDPCEAPHVFFLHSVENSTEEDQIATTYIRASPRGLPNCSSSGNHSADQMAMIRVFSPVKLPLEAGGRDCCNVVYTLGMNITEVRYRPCMGDEVTA